jgi:outer membrane protein OmpA-like peptidoglycan-associated protein
MSVPGSVPGVLASPGQALEAGTRQSMEAALGYDLSRVRVHTDEPAGASAAQLGALAYAVGEHVVFGRDRYRPETPEGRWTLAHELAHVVQQRGGGGGALDPQRLTVGRSDDPQEREADLVADAVVRQAPGAAPPRLTPAGAIRISRLTPAQFQTQLGSTPEQKLAVDTLFANPTFKGLWDYMAACPALPKKDLGPLSLAVTPGLVMSGKERFGGYFFGPKKLEINPTKAEHVSNPAELVDTVLHELIHAVDHLKTDCTAAGAGPAPLGGAATATPPSRADAIASGNEAKLNKDQGPGASDPCGEFIDINAAAQATVASVVADNLKTTQVGHPTLVFLNTIIRGNPTALAAYEACRKPACGLATKVARDAAVADCSRKIIGKFIPAGSQAAIVPTRVQFDFGKDTLRADATEKLTLIAIFLKEHAATKVKLVGHADKVGTPGSNMILGQGRADAVKTFLLGQGVPPGQITSTTSVGQTASIAAGPSQNWMDRSVEITP